MTTHEHECIHEHVYTYSYTEIGGEGKEKGEIIKDNLMAGGFPPCTAGVLVGHLGFSAHRFTILSL